MMKGVNLVNAAWWDGGGGFEGGNRRRDWLGDQVLDMIALN